MNVVLITGMLSAGKTISLRVFEDIGYYVIDNMPPSLIRPFISLAKESGKQQDTAFVIDMRAESYFSELKEAVEYLRSSKDFTFTILYIDADDETLIARYKTSRRRHSLMKGSESMQATIRRERELLEPFKDMADYYIDTSATTESQFREKIRSIFEGAESIARRFIVNVVSFGFKYTLPRDADIVFDVRFAPNPFYIEELKHTNGLNPDTAAYVLDKEETRRFLRMAFDMISYLLPFYEKEGKSQLVIAVGCTGGKHRSVAIAERLGEMLSGKDVYVAVSHRDMDKDNK
ncbi:MAG: RNase adapter RapZ [Eubacteriaceae bacterium]|nr:RNase adapter RapZ [Eubacteriaceae bacterium]